MTEKDYYKIKKFNINEIKYLKVSLFLENKEYLISTIKKIL